ncbi:NAD(P)/FAD-dependent oxidoreductase [Tuwongella immobilis]|nr:NAD(P)/FAD-dependent oxidoreductase [Tuwongella immobilis]
MSALQPIRVVILGGGFGGVYASRRLGQLLGSDRRYEITLVSRDNYFLMCPLLFEAASGVIELNHAVNPIRPLLKHTQFVNALVDSIDFEHRTVMAHSVAGDRYTLAYDHLVLALGAVTNRHRTPGSEFALGFKNVSDAVLVRNRVIQAFERADAESDPERRKANLTFVVIGGGLVGVELVGELTEFSRRLLRNYPRIRPEEIRLVLLQHGARILPEMAEGLASYAERQFQKRGVEIRTHVGADRIEPERVWLSTGESIAASTIVLAAGLEPNPVIARLPLAKDRAGRVRTDECMRVVDHPGVWALGDCAAIPDEQGNAYPTLAQHAMREGKRLGENLAAVLAGKEPKPFRHKNLGTLAALGHHRGIANLMGLPVSGFFAWWIWRSYYLFQMPRWERRLRIMVDWTVGLFFRPEPTKIDLDPEPCPDSGHRMESAAAQPMLAATAPAGDM